MRIEELIARDATGNLQPEERDTLEGTLAKDPELRKVVEQLRSIDVIVSSISAPPTSWETIRTSIDKALRGYRWGAAILLAPVIVSIVAVAVAWMFWGAEKPVIVAILAGMAIVELPICVGAALIAIERRRRLKDATRDWSQLRSEWASHLDHSIRAERSSRWLFRIMLALATLQVAIELIRPDGSAAMLAVVASLFVVCLLGVWLPPRQGRRLEAEREELRTLFDA